MKKVYYFGNEYVSQDALAVNVAHAIAKVSDLKDFEFIHIKDTFSLIDLDFRDSVLLDVSTGVDKVCIVDSDNINFKTISSTHDFDLGFFLKLSGKYAKIIVIPLNYDFEKAVKEVKSLLGNF